MNLEDKFNKILKYAQWHINCINETIQDYIDDDIIANQEFIYDLREDLEYWNDILRILDNKPTYIDYMF